MQYNINIKAIAAETFGYSRFGGYQVPQSPARDQAVANPAQPMVYEAEGVGALGLPVWTKVGLKFAGRRVELLDVILTIELDKNIVITPVQGRKGTVKEYIQPGDFAIVIQGILATDINDEHRFRYPFEKVEELKSLVYLGETLEVTSRHLAVHGITNLVVKNVKWPPTAGFVNMQSFELQCLSDEPYELRIK